LPPAFNNQQPHIKIYFWSPRGGAKRQRAVSENKRRCEASEESLFTGSLDDSVLVGFGGIAVALAVGETLHHLLRSASSKP